MLHNRKSLEWEEKTFVSETRILLSTGTYGEGKGGEGTTFLSKTMVYGQEGKNWLRANRKISW